jgi:hypothetical protein
MAVAGCDRGGDSAGVGQPSSSGAGTTEADLATAGSDAPALPPEVAGQIDLLRQYRIEDDVLYGRARRENGALIAEGVGGRSLVRIPVEPPVRYDLEVELTRLDGPGSVLLGLVLEKSHCAIKIDAQTSQGYLTALDSVDGWSPEYEVYPLTNLVYHGQLLLKDTRSTLICRVRGDSLSLTVDGKQIFEFNGRLDRLSFPESFRMAAARRAFYIGGSDTRLKFGRVQLRPVGPGPEAAR